MANEVLNPFQQFLDDGGRELAKGTIEFFENGGTVTPITVYSDSDLTVSQSNPYTLDDYGRIRGDVKYSGLATLLIKNANGIEIRQLDDVVTAADDTGFTHNVDTVADMVASLSLAVGDLVETERYYAETSYGGARYLIVPGGTAIADDFLYHDLGNGLQARLLDVDRNKNLLVAGARGDGGSNDTQAIQAVVNLGGDVYVPGGFVFVATNILIGKDVRFHGGGTIKQEPASSGDLFQITDRSVSLVKFRDVTLDGNQGNGNSDNSIVGWVLTNG